MKHGKRMIIVALLIILAAASLVVAQSKSSAMTWYVIDGGGGVSEGAGMALAGSMGYWGTEPSTGGSHGLRADFLGPRNRTGSGPPPQGIRVYLPSITR